MDTSQEQIHETYNMKKKKRKERTYKDKNE